MTLGQLFIDEAAWTEHQTCPVDPRGQRRRFGSPLESGAALLALALAASGCDGEAVNACEELCTLGTCDGDTCTRPAGVVFVVYDSERIDASGVSTRVTQAGACAVGRSVQRFEVVETSGACFRVQTTTLQADPDNLPFDAGTVTLQDATSGTVELAPEGTCLLAVLPPGAAFKDGETVQVGAAGGADIPALSLSLPAPVTPTVTVSQGGANYLDLDVQWTPPSPRPTNVVAVTPAGAGECAPYQDGWLTVPSKMRPSPDGGSGSTEIRVGNSSIISKDIGSTDKQASLLIDAEKVVTICTAPDHLSVVTERFQAEKLDGVVMSAATATVCARATYSTKVTILATDGPCWLEKTENLVATDLLPIDIGTLTIDTPIAGKFELALSPGGSCGFKWFAEDALFAAGDDVAAEGTGDGDLPAFSLATTAPAPLALDMPSQLQLGQPFTITWTPGEEVQLIMFTSTDSDANHIVCKGNEQGELTVSAALTAAFEPLAPSGYVTAMRINKARTDLGGGISALLLAMVGEQKEIDYAP